MGNLNDKPLEALLCGHTYHSECIIQYCSVTAKNKEEACPLKCYHYANTRSEVIFPIEDNDEVATEPGEDSDPQVFAAAIAAQDLASSVIG